MADQEDTPSTTPPASEPARNDPAPSGTGSVGREPKTIVVERRPGFFARWLARLAALLLFLGILIVAVFVVVSLVLRSDVPRSLAESVATKALGLDLSLADLDVGWDGDVTIHELVLRLPSLGEAEGEKLLEVRRLKAQIEPLPRVALNYLRGRQPEVKRLEIESPTAYATQRADGEWNITRAIALVSGSRGGRGSESTPGHRRTPLLPELTVSDGKMIVRDGSGREAHLAGFELTGRRDSPLVYRIAGGSAGAFQIDGELFPASGKRQQFELELGGINEQLRAMFGLPQASLVARWEGGVSDGGTEGLLRIESARVDEMQIAGDLKLSSAAGTTTITPVHLTATGVPVADRVEVPEGTILVDSRLRAQQVLLNTMEGQILVRSATFDASAGATLDAIFKDIRPRDQDRVSGEVLASAGYDAFGEPVVRAELRSSGNLGDTSFERLDMEVVADGSVYHDWRTLDILVTLRDSPLLIRPPEAPTTLPEAEARILVRLDDEQQPRIELERLRSLNPDIMDVRGRGVYFTAAAQERQPGDYLFSFEQRGLPVKLPRVEDRVPLFLGFDLKGRYYRDPDPARTVIAPVEITRLYGELAEVELEGVGKYVIVANGQTPNPPLTLSLTLTRAAMIPAPVIPAATDIIGARAQVDRPGQAPTDAPGGEITQAEAIQIEPIRGRIRSWLDVSGDPLTMEFKGAGGVQTSDFAIGAMELGTVRSDLELALTRDYLTIHTPSNQQRAADAVRYAQLFGAHVDFEAVIPFRDDQPGLITVDIAEMDLGLASQALAAPGGISGTLDGRLSIDLSGLSPRQATARGWFIINELKVPRAELAQRVTIGLPPRDENDDARGGVLMSEGLFNVPVELRHFAELAPGPTPLGEERTLSFNFGYDLRQPRQLQVLNLKAQNYPIVLPPVQEGGRYIDTEWSLSAPALFVEFDQAVPEIRAQIAVGGQVWTGTEPFAVGLLADGELEISASRDRVDLEGLFIDLPEIGIVTGGGMLDLADLPARSRIYLHGEALNLEALAWRLSLPEGATGLADFSLSVQPGPGEHPQGEVLVNLAFSGDEARWRTVEIDQGQAMVYVSRVPLPDKSPSRGQFDFTLLTTERVHLQLAGGTIDGYFKLRNRGRAREIGEPSIFSPLASFGDDWYVNGTLEGRGLNLAQVARVMDEEDISGVLDFSAIAYGNLNQKPGFGEAEEDVPLFPLNGEGSAKVTRGELRNFNLFQRPMDYINAITRTPQYDSVDARFRLEQGHGYLDSLQAFVDGTELHITGRLYDVLDPDVTRIEGSAVIFNKPLAQIPLPFFREADEIFSVIQSNATAFRVSGTLKDPGYQPVLFSEIGETLRVLLVPSLKRQ